MPVTEDELSVLMICSDNHYDQVCRSYSQFGGLIHTCVKMDFEEIQMTWRDMDIICKILEVRRLSFVDQPAKFALANNVHYNLIKIMDHCQKLQDQWTSSVEVRDVT
jgi:hypothetical protein